MDGMGKLPGVTKGFMKEVVTDRSGTDAFHAWEQQSEKDRNYQFNSAVKGNTLENNEQIHWEAIPLEQSLAALVCDPDTLSELLPLCHKNADGNHVIAFAGRDIPVITASQSDHLLSKLNEHGVTNPKGQVRLKG